MISECNNLFHDQIADKVRVITTTNNNITTYIYKWIVSYCREREKRMMAFTIDRCRLGKARKTFWIY